MRYQDQINYWTLTEAASFAAAVQELGGYRLWDEAWLLVQDLFLRREDTPFPYAYPTSNPDVLAWKFDPRNPAIGPLLVVQFRVLHDVEGNRQLELLDVRTSGSDSLDNDIPAE